MLTKDESVKLAQIDQKLDDFIATAMPILQALNGPQGWFALMESRMSAQENRSKMVFAIFGGGWALMLVILGALTQNFYKTITAIDKTITAIEKLISIR